MALRLEVISSQRQVLGALSSIVLGVSGGSIGRALDNDWALPDPRRYLSGLHARIHVRQGGYYLEDCSTNGVFVNDQRVQMHTLINGDVVRVGDFLLRYEGEEVVELGEGIQEDESSGGGAAGRDTADWDQPDEDGLYGMHEDGVLIAEEAPEPLPPPPLANAPS